MSLLPTSKKEADAILAKTSFHKMTDADRAAFEGIEDRNALISYTDEIVVIAANSDFVFIEADEGGGCFEVWLSDFDVTGSPL